MYDDDVRVGGSSVVITIKVEIDSLYCRVPRSFLELIICLILSVSFRFFFFFYDGHSDFSRYVTIILYYNDNNDGNDNTIIIRRTAVELILHNIRRTTAGTYSRCNVTCIAALIHIYMCVCVSLYIYIHV